MVCRCGWVNEDPQYVDYHDHEWGVPVHDDRKLFEMLVLEGAQAGLSWYTVLKKRERYREAFDGFDPELVAQYGEAKIEELLADPGLIRNRLKIEGAVKNARAFLRTQAEFGTFDQFIWSFTGGVTRDGGWATLSEVPASTPESEAMSKSLKKRGFTFVGPTICYAFMQATGMVYDHVESCFLYKRAGD